MADQDLERQPLLRPTENDARNLPDLTRGPPAYSVGSVLVIGPDELPPPYEKRVGVPTVSCRVCSAMVDISGKKDQHVVKCTSCNEATPIRNAPPGRKYVRCPCNCLLICKVSSQRIACPREACKSVISLVNSTPQHVPVPQVPGMGQVKCAHCHDTFIFNTLNNVLARCPHCRKDSSVGPEFARTRSLLFLALGLLLLSLGLAVTFTTLSWATRLPGLYALYAAVFLVAAVLLARSLYYCVVKVSLVEGAS